MAGGRPAKYGIETRTEICKRIASGESLTAICKDEHMPYKDQVLDWLFDEPEFSTQYARAREAQAEHYLDEIISISDDSMLDTEIDPATGNERTNPFALVLVEGTRNGWQWRSTLVASRAHFALLALAAGAILALPTYRRMLAAACARRPRASHAMPARKPGLPQRPSRRAWRSPPRPADSPTAACRCGQQCAPPASHAPGWRREPDRHRGGEQARVPATGFPGRVHSRAEFLRCSADRSRS